MLERFARIATAEGPMETFLTRPERAGPHPLVIVYMDVWGLREELFDIARRIAVVGYACAVPDFYHRQGRVRNAFRDAGGRMISVERLTEAQKEVIRMPLRKLTDAMVTADTGALLDALAADTAIGAGTVGAIGYCMGGRHALRAAAAYPARFAAVASLHGTEMATTRPDSPHRGLAGWTGELYCGYGERDPFAAPEVIAAMRATFAGGPATYHDCVHALARHGYALPDRDVFDRAAADRDWEHIYPMFARRLH